MTALDRWLAERAARREQAGLVRELTVSEVDGSIVDLAGNDYLGLARDSRVIEAAVAGARRYGAGATASRLVSGTLSVHSDLERSLARFTGFATALVCSTGYHANLAVVSALADQAALIVSDAHVHASLIDACRLTRARIAVVAHNDVAAVTAALARRSQPRAYVLIESIYSVDGDPAPIEALAKVCESHDAVLIVDEAHATGVAGAGGRGLVAAAGLTTRGDVIATTTLSKALGAQGGVVLASAAVRDHLVNHARPFIYDTGLAPPAAAAALAALDILEHEPSRVARVREVAGVLADACGVAPPAGAVLSVPMAGPAEALAAVAVAADRGLRIGCFRPPSTPDGSSRLRITAHAHHTDEQVAYAAGILRELVA